MWLWYLRKIKLKLSALYVVGWKDHKLESLTQCIRVKLGIVLIYAVSKMISELSICSWFDDASSYVVVLDGYDEPKRLWINLQKWILCHGFYFIPVCIFFLVNLICPHDDLFVFTLSNWKPATFWIFSEKKMLAKTIKEVTHTQLIIEQ